MARHNLLFHSIDAASTLGDPRLVRIKPVGAKRGVFKSLLGCILACVCILVVLANT